jgi:hypothetical protein
MDLCHPVKDKLTDAEVDTLLLGIYDTSVFYDHLELLAQSKYSERDCDKFKGDLFELFVEFLIKYKGTDNRIAIGDYKVVLETGISDYSGIDGVGISTKNSGIATVQAKYRQAHVELTWKSGDFADFQLDSRNIYDIKYIMYDIIEV